MKSLFKYWHLDGVMAIFLLCICIVYFLLNGFRNNKRSAYFFMGYGLLIISVASPLYFLGENYLMSAHMASHINILLIAAPLLVLGIPENTDNKLLFWLSDKLMRFPWLPWMIGVCIMWFWHIPVIFNQLFDAPDETLLKNGFSGAHILQNVHLMSLVLAGILFSWPVVGPIPSRRIAPLNAVLYLSAACIFCSILGLLITFAPVGIYTHYIHIVDRFGFLNRIRNEGGISILVDQQMAGLIMWVPGCLIYLSGSMYLLMKWFREKKEKPALFIKNTSP
jgi:putative membrane protein